MRAHVSPRADEAQATERRCLRRHRKNAATRLATLILLGSIGLAGCESIYLHSDKDQKAMEQARAGFDAAKKAQLDALAKQRVALEQLVVRQRTAAVRNAIALRDAILAMTIDNARARNWQSSVKAYSSARLQLL